MSSPAPDPGQRDRLRIDDLARESGISSGTIRFYQREGLIEPPAREGRVAYYAPEQLEVLERIRSLQAQGLPLAVIGDLLRREREGEETAPWLQLDSAVFSSARKPERLTAKWLASVGLVDADLEGLVNAGLLSRRSNGDFEALPGVGEMMRELVEGGVDPRAFRFGAQLVADRLRAVAEALADLGWGLFEADRERIESGEQIAPEVLAKLERMQALARRIVSQLFPTLLEEVIRERVEPYAVEVASRRSSRGGR